LARFEGRLGALSRRTASSPGNDGKRCPLRRLICDTFTAVRSDDERLDLHGPDLMLPPKVAVSLAMAIHELATNALKYGSLSTETGKVTIRWSTENERLKVEWKEQGGAGCADPDQPRLWHPDDRTGTRRGAGWKVRIHYEPDGVRCEVDAPIPTYG
jgi:hypothetical protein